MVKKVYFYKFLTGEFKGEGVAQKSPLETNKYLLPKRATFSPPPEVKQDEVAVFNKNTNTWEIKKDFRGSYQDLEGNEIKIEEIGQQVPEGYFTQSYLKEYHKNKQEIPLTNEEVSIKRQIAYSKESDPIFFKWQRGEATKNEWLSSIEEIKQRYPKPE